MVKIFYAVPSMVLSLCQRVMQQYWQVMIRSHNPLQSGKKVEGVFLLRRIWYIDATLTFVSLNLALV